jgi:hypothetical protein
VARPSGQACGFFDGSLCASSGHTSSISSRIESLTTVTRSNSRSCSYKLLLLLGEHDPALEDVWLIDALGWGHGTRLSNGTPPRVSRVAVVPRPLGEKRKGGAAKANTGGQACECCSLRKKEGCLWRD